MGDGPNVVRQRMEEDYSSLQEGLDLNNSGKELGKEVKDVKDLSLEQKDLLVQRYSGDPGERTGRVQRSAAVLETNLPEMVVTEPEVVPFPYADTKLRPEAPPFTPECVSPNPEPVYGEADNDNSCFVNVELKLPIQEAKEVVFTEGDVVTTVVKHPKESNEIKEASLKPFSLPSAEPQLKKSIPDVEIPDIGDEEDPIVAVRPTASTGSETQETPVIERVRILSPAYFFGNKTQIIVVVASVVVCIILVIFVLV